MVTGNYSTIDNRKDPQEAIDNTQVNTSSDGYTTGVSSDKLTNSDFLKLMIQELKMQDPTKPMDSDRMMDNQLKMSTIEANLDMSTSMNQLKMSFESSAISTAAQMIGRLVEMETEFENDDGEIESIVKEYRVKSVEQHDGELFGEVQEITGTRDTLINTDVGLVDYDDNGFIYEDGKFANLIIKLDEDGRVAKDGNGNIILSDGEANAITDSEILSKFYTNGITPIYGEIQTLPLSAIQKVSSL